MDGTCKATLSRLPAGVHLKKNMIIGTNSWQLPCHSITNFTIRLLNLLLMDFKQV